VSSRAPSVPAALAPRGEAAVDPRRGAVAAVVAVCAFLVAFGALHYGFYTRNLLVDTPIYERYGDALVHHGRIPYRDFSVEYPPAAIAVFAAPSLLTPTGDFKRYVEVFEALMLLCGAAAAGLVALLLARQGAPPARLLSRALLAGVAPLLLGPVVLSRFDLWPALLTIGALGLLATGRNRLGFGLLAVAISAKLYPAVLLPLAVAHVSRGRGRREAVVCLSVALGVIAAVVVPFAVVAPHGLWTSLSGQASRPLQVESLGASLFLAAHQAFGTAISLVYSHGSTNLSGHAAGGVAALQTLVAAAALVALWVGYARGPADTGRLFRYSAACVCAFVAFGKVLSPQYLIWLIPLVLLVPGRRGDVAAALLAAAMVVTQLWFPSHYLALTYDLDPRASWFVLARDLLLVALLLTLAWPAGRARAWRGRTVGLAVIVAGGAVAAAAASSSVHTGATHSGLLNETGVASSCAAPKRAPSVTGGSAVYDTVSLPNAAPHPRCVWVTLKAAGRLQLFAAAYSRRFVPTDPQTNYLGDSGICTNLPGVTGPANTLSALVAARTRFVVDVEACNPGPVKLDYVLDVRTTARPLALVSATAGQTGDGVRVAWRAAGDSGGLVFVVSRTEGGRTTAVARMAGSRATRYAYVDRAPLHASATYAVAAESSDGNWDWRGPLAPGR
jgi:hypothetical protein